MIRKTTMADVKELHSFIQKSSKSGEILPRSLFEIYQFIRDYWIYRPNSKGPIRAASSFHICWENLGEVRNLFVDESLRGHGLGEELVKLAVAESKELGVNNIFALTYRANFFIRLGFREVDKQQLPSKVWADCLNCVKFPDCDETAVLFERGVDTFHRRKTAAKKK